MTDATQPSEEERRSALEDPKFPDRPITYDFLRLSDCVQWLDDQAELDGDPAELVKQYVDAESLFYLVQQRIRTINGDAASLAAYVEGVLVGARFQALGGKRDD